MTEAYDVLTEAYDVLTEATHGEVVVRVHHMRISVGGLQVQTRLQTGGAAYEERGSEQNECEVGYSPRVEEAPSGAPTGKKGHRERLTMAETCLDVLEASVEELYQGQGRLLGVESS
ncbi:hypothetical protein B296_00027571 [Ensete ventricosum]|uniref:Uncharacterized protein n=1 Tax=Ensete ventricosum TaxID=4639 RepID=A0A427AJB7_ENSVE|nr:hypothetical protein B296_00027571 [Ensete ventricosum]